MLFNSFEFIFLFLPVTVIGFYALGKAGGVRPAIGWLVAMSLFFYGWWNPDYLALIIFSVLFNFIVGLFLAKSNMALGIRRLVLALGVSTNLGLIGYYKYANFFVDTINSVTGADFELYSILLPIGISFFTFQQIAFLVDAFQKKTKEYRFLHYCLFVTFFPQLIAGPIVHHLEMMPQFAKRQIFQFELRDFSIGLTIFCIGLFKKVVIADGVAIYSTSVFDAALLGGAPTFTQAWGAALAFTFQLYFDFSGYSDMAIGLGRLFGIRLPLNFHSPYKADSIIDFWRRWHMTLSRFLRNYLYFPLGGNRRGVWRRHLNVLITMLLGGLWHGANWTFVFWGGLHGLFLVVNHAWRKLRKILGWTAGSSRLGRGMARLCTFFAVVVSWVFFRAENIDAAWSMIFAMAGFNGIVLPEKFFFLLGPAGPLLSELGVQFAAPPAGHWEVAKEMMAYVLLLAIVWFAPNTQEIMSRYRPALQTYANLKWNNYPRWAYWRPNLCWSFFSAVVASAAVLGITQISEFLYFQF